MKLRDLVGLRSIALAFGVILSGCSTPKVEIDPTLNAANAGTIFVYRPTTEWVGMAMDFRVTVDREYIGSLQTGEFISSYVKPGGHAVTVQPHFLSVPDGKPFTIILDTVAAKEYYLRFSQHVDEILTMPGVGTSVSGHVQLQQVTYEVWEQRL